MQSPRAWALLLGSCWSSLPEILQSWHEWDPALMRGRMWHRNKVQYFFTMPPTVRTMLFLGPNLYSIQELALFNSPFYIRELEMPYIPSLRDLADCSRALWFVQLCAWDTASIFIISLGHIWCLELFEDPHSKLNRIPEDSSCLKQLLNKFAYWTRF